MEPLRPLHLSAPTHQVLNAEAVRDVHGQDIDDAARDVLHQLLRGLRAWGSGGREREEPDGAHSVHATLGRLLPTRPLVMACNNKSLRCCRQVPASLPSSNRSGVHAHTRNTLQPPIPAAAAPTARGAPAGHQHPVPLLEEDAGQLLANACGRVRACVAAPQGCSRGVKGVQSSGAPPSYACPLSHVPLFAPVMRMVLLYEPSPAAAAAAARINAMRTYIVCLDETAAICRPAFREAYTGTWQGQEQGRDVGQEEGRACIGSAPLEGRVRECGKPRVARGKPAM